MLIPKDDFWLTSSGNFLDTCVLDWCKLFADKRAKHYWEGLVSDKQAFLAGLLKALGISETEFSEIIRDIRRYRDKFIAHLDDQNVMEIPDLKVPKDSTMFLYKHLLTEGVNPELPLPNDIEEYYKFHMAYAEKIYLQKET